MKKNLLIGIVSLACVVAIADDATNKPPSMAASKTRVKCTICNGRGHLKVSPPDVGQFQGRIEHRSHWDVKLNPCPVCYRGRGWREAWDLTQPEPTEAAPCTKCGWSGIIQCRRCLASGLADCSNSNCKDGWIIDKASSYKRSARKPESVRPCPECKGVGKILCKVCKGMRAAICNRCYGAGAKRK
jgi:hypothetical protein